MARPSTTFDKPQFNLTRDSCARMYANVSNELAVLSEHKGTRHVAVVVPTMLFTFMREVFNVPVTDEVTLYLAPQDEYFVFGIAWGTGDDNICDLWSYTGTNLPNFLR